MSARAYEYLKGLFQADKKNMERMEERIPAVKYEPLQYFLSDSDWEWTPITNQISQDVNKLLGGNEDSALYIDETGIPKKGNMSVGVNRQWCGELGKVDNCQVAVFATLGCDRFSTPINFRLYLPSDWTDDKDRCIKAKIPVSEIVPKTKHDLALEMVFHARQSGVDFKWVGFDGFYGNNPEFLRQLDCNSEIFVADVHSNQRIYIEDPQPIVPQPKSNKGTKPKNLKAQTEAIRVDKWLKKQPEEAWQREEIRESTKGILFVDVIHSQVWLWDGKEPEAKKWHLVVRREVNSPEKIKYSLSNAPAGTPIQRLAYMQGQRYWVERPFQDAKNQCGMGDYQVRGWLAWHHHMTMVVIAMLFMLEERLDHVEDIPLLSCADVTILLKSILPKRDITEKEVLRQLKVRHQKRQSSIFHAYEKQRLLCAEMQFSP